MTNRQFNFSLSVGIALAVTGALILSQATVGLSLIALGAAIAVLALFTRFSSKQNTPSRAAARDSRPHDSAPGYPSRALTE